MGKPTSLRQLWNWDFAPVQDLARDNRWGLYYQTWAEEPVLAAALGGANVRGLQSAGGPGSLGVTATVKHFAGYSESSRAGVVSATSWPAAS